MALGTAREWSEVVPLVPETAGGWPQSKPFIFPSPHFSSTPDSLQEAGCRVDCTSLVQWEPTACGARLDLSGSLPWIAMECVGACCKAPQRDARAPDWLDSSCQEPLSPQQWCCPDPLLVAVVMECQGAHGWLWNLLLWVFSRGRRNPLGWWKKPQVLLPGLALKFSSLVSWSQVWVLPAASWSRDSSTGQSWLCQTWKWQKCWSNSFQRAHVSGLM